MMAFIVFDVDVIVAIHGQPALVASTLIVVENKVIESSWIKRNRYTWVRNNYTSYVVRNWSHQAFVVEFN